ncbi:MarR family transcriptional regulator [Ruicaihuangia caeni]|uniref:MarR family transcriptional regulator n=1 Tax=Ruicaihuangia caeni TaxID=3042517 RepID=UPI00338F3EEB
MTAQSRPIGFWLKLVDRLIDDRFITVLEEHGVTRRQWQLLNVLSAGEADVARLDAAVAPFIEGAEGESSVEHLTELIESGWVGATQGGYEITERGSVAFGRLSEVVSQLRDDLGSDVDEADYDTTLRTLEAMARNLGWRED